MKKYKPYTGHDRISGIVTLLAAIAMIGLIAAAYIVLRPREYEMQPIEDEQWDWSTWAPEPAAQPLGASYTLTAADTKARIDRHNTDVIAAWTDDVELIMQYTNTKCVSTSDTEQEKISPPEDEVLAAAKLLGNATGFGECYEGQIEDKVKVMWVVLNRVESPTWTNTVIGVITQPGQFCGYHAYTVPSDESLQIARDVLTAWYNSDYTTRHETCGDAIHLYFSGGGGRENVFRERY